MSSEGRSEGLAIVWNKSLQLKRFFLPSAICTELYSSEVGKGFILINVYGPFHQNFGIISDLEGVKRNNVILGGDMNFILKTMVLQGDRGKMDPLA
jgi:hypothetical protein